MAKIKKQSFQAQSEQHTQEEAMRMAKANQRPGQGKEQTKLIAKGIEKGIAEYKKQEKAKVRVRNKTHHKAQKSSSLNSIPEQADGKEVGRLVANGSKLPLLVSGLAFSLIAIHHLVWFFTGTSLFLDGVIIPSQLSLLVAGVCVALAGWVFYSRSK